LSKNIVGLLMQLANKPWSAGVFTQQTPQMAHFAESICFILAYYCHKEIFA
jgi:hypothetical protein